MRSLKNMVERAGAKTRENKFAQRANSTENDIDKPTVSGKILSTFGVRKSRD
jgi:hypothetical protein